MKKSWLRGTVLAVLIVAGLALGVLAAAGFFDRDAVSFVAARGGGKRPVAAVLFSGDMGLRLGMGPHVSRALARIGVPVLGLSSSTEFATRKTRAQVDAFIADAVRDALRRTRADKVLIIGQSFGSDIARVGLVSLPEELRERVAAIILVVPGRGAYFRADPTGLSYRAAPDEGPVSAAALDWAPLICISGVRESDSLCPLLKGSNVRWIALPGGHFLRNDHKLLVSTILAALRPILVSQGVHA